jgi:hypothetical protein
MLKLITNLKATNIITKLVSFLRGLKPTTYLISPTILQEAPSSVDYFQYGLLGGVFLLGSFATIGLLIYLNQPTYIDLPDEKCQTDGSGTQSIGTQTNAN